MKKKRGEEKKKRKKKKKKKRKGMELFWNAMILYGNYLGMIARVFYGLLGS